MIPPLEIWQITSPFGYRVHPITGELSFHNGIDLAAPVGTPVFAPEFGYVDSWLDNEIGGYQMIVQHSDGTRTGYAHLSDRIAEPGQEVMKGEVIAKTGDTGRVTGPHLHFNYKDANGDFQDPASLIYEYTMPEVTVRAYRSYWWLVGAGAVTLTYLAYRRRQLQLAYNEQTYTTR